MLHGLIILALFVNIFGGGIEFKSNRIKLKDAENENTNNTDTSL